MDTFAFTGARFLDSAQTKMAREVLNRLPRRSCWLVGCAGGLDALAREIAPKTMLLFEAHNRKPWELQARSKRMIDECAACGGTLHAFPNKPCPVELTRDRWCGSGTWGTAFYAHLKGCPVIVHPLTAINLPGWLDQEQLSLF